MSETEINRDAWFCLVRNEFPCLFVRDIDYIYAASLTLKLGPFNLKFKTGSWIRLLNDDVLSTLTFGDLKFLKRCYLEGIDFVDKGGSGDKIELLLKNTKEIFKVFVDNCTSAEIIYATD